jgi:hypothetical protein
MVRKPETIKRFYPASKTQNPRLATDKGTRIIGRYRDNSGKIRYGVFTNRWNPFRRIK